ncbi:MAG: 4Fe-4S dicluster-binding protein [candidate division WOR-3 bacterium]|nr:4Fe-4S dicluster-binding protein [candidate division WOR-3 bacterium]
MAEKKRGWKELPIGAIIDEAGSSEKFKTGDWREGRKPVLNEDKCTNCLLCWIFCPDSAIIVSNNEMKGFKYDYCKGCGICANQCPIGAIEMVPEEE